MTSVSCFPLARDAPSYGWGRLLTSTTVSMGSEEEKVGRGEEEARAGCLHQSMVSMGSEEEKVGRGEEEARAGCLHQSMVSMGSEEEKVGRGEEEAAYINP